MWKIRVRILILSILMINVFLYMGCFSGETSTSEESDLPIQTSVTFNIDENSETGTVAGTITPSFTDPDGAIIYSLADTDIFTIGSDTGIIVFDSAEGLDYETCQEIEFKALIKENGRCAEEVAVTVIINDLIDTPVAVDDAFQTDEDTLLTGNVLIANPDDADISCAGGTLSVVSVNGEGTNVGSGITLDSGAMLTVNQDGSFVYDPNDSFEYLKNDSATDTFTYRISEDGIAELSRTATVTITIAGVNDAPVVIMSGDIEASEDRFILITVTGTDVDDNDDDLTARIAVFPDPGTGWLWQYTDDFNSRIQINGLSPVLTDELRRFYIEPPANAYGVITVFQVQLFDGTSYSEPKELVYDIADINDPPELPPIVPDA